MKHFWFILALIVGLAALLVSTQVYVRRDCGWIDAISGSRKSQAVWRFGWSSPLIVSDSPLAERYRKLGLRWEPERCNVKGTYLNIFGHSVGHGHGSAPPIYYFAPQDLQRSYLAASSDRDVRELFQMMSSGSEAEKKAAVEAALDKAFGRYAATRPGE